MITVEDLKKRYGNKEVLDAVSISFEQGNINGIVGANGAGKTTLMKCIAGLIDYDGTISYSKGSLRGTVGYLPTHPHIISRITGREYLQLMCNARSMSCPDFNQKNIFDLPLNQYTETYSTGMLKKLALISILLQPNEIYLLDEPFSGVDVQSNLLIKELLLKLKSLGKVIIMSSHIFSSLHETCDFLHYLESGKLIQSVSKGGFSTIEAEMMKKDVRKRVEQFELN